MPEIFDGEIQPEWVVHLCEKEAWQAALEQGYYRAASLDEVGFIHCSRPDQVRGVANRYYSGCTNLVLLWIDPNRLGASLRWEAADGDLFPHIYGQLNLEAIRAVVDFPADQDGHFSANPVYPE